MKKKPARRASTALARRPAPVAPPRQQIELVINDPRQMLPTPAAAVPPGTLEVLRELDDKVLIGGLGTVEYKFTPEEEAVLSRPVNEADVLMKPTGQPYLSHPTYTRWFNEALGRGGWALVPVSKPRIAGKVVACEYVIYIHGRPLAFALGEQDYIESNKEQTYGDAYEATNASALRRVAKRLGIGLELWDKRWLNSFIERKCIKVCKDGEDKPQWRRVDDPPFWWERKQGNVRERNGDDVNTRTGEVRGNHVAQRHDGDEVISNIPRDPKQPNKKVGQVQRLAIIIKKSGREVEAVKAWMAIAYGYTSTKDIKRKHYDAICAAVESPHPLPPGPHSEAREGELVDREPGEEG